MENKHMMAFEIIRGLVAILIAIAVALSFTFVNAGISITSPPTIDATRIAIKE